VEEQHECRVGWSNSMSAVQPAVPWSRHRVSAMKKTLSRMIKIQQLSQTTTNLSNSIQLYVRHTVIRLNQAIIESRFRPRCSFSSMSKISLESTEP